MAVDNVGPFSVRFDARMKTVAVIVVGFFGHFVDTIFVFILENPLRPIYIVNQWSKFGIFQHTKVAIGAAVIRFIPIVNIAHEPVRYTPGF